MHSIFATPTRYLTPPGFTCIKNGLTMSCSQGRRVCNMFYQIHIYLYYSLTYFIATKKEHVLNTKLILITMYSNVEKFCPSLNVALCNFMHTVKGHLRHVTYALYYHLYLMHVCYLWVLFMILSVHGVMLIHFSYSTLIRTNVFIIFFIKGHKGLEFAHRLIFKRLNLIFIYFFRKWLMIDRRTYCGVHVRWRVRIL